MKIEDLVRSWPAREQNKDAVIELWDSMASSYSEKFLPSREDDAFMQLLDRLGLSGSVLDVGCGGGVYSLAIAGQCTQVTGIDLSSKMLETAKKRADTLKIENVDFLYGDWKEMSLENVGWNHHFDFVLAHLTPAVQNVETFQKLTDASRGWCLLSKHIRRKDALWDSVKDILQLGRKRESADEEMLCGFQLLWMKGYCPHLDYEKRSWISRRPWEKTAEIFLKRARTYRIITRAEEDNVLSFLHSRSVDGELTEYTESTVATIYWNVNERGGKI